MGLASLDGVAQVRLAREATEAQHKFELQGRCQLPSDEIARLAFLDIESIVLDP